MYGLIIDGIEVKPPQPITFIGEIKIWEEIVKDAAAIASPGSLVDACRLTGRSYAPPLVCDKCGALFHCECALANHPENGVNV